MKGVNHRIVVFLALATILVMASCAPKKPKDDAAAGGGGAISESDVNADLADSDSNHAMGLQTVHFAYDSSILDTQARDTLTANAKVLKDHTSLKVQIEGHCDERGGIQYNIALGERRAKSTKAFLVSHGVKANRMSIISYGKEKPLDPGHDESAYTKNRRANFRVTEK